MRFTHIRNAFWTAVIVVPLLAVGRPVAAQQGRITGTVTDKLNNTPLPGARMQLGNRFTNTNRDGHYTFAGVGAGTYTVRATAIGFGSATASVTVADTTATVDFALTRSVIMLDEIVGTPTGDQRARESGTPIANVQADSLTQNQTISNFGDLLSGRVAGVMVAQSGGSVGTGTRIRIRGESSISLSNEPVYYVDGIKVESGDNSLSIGVGGQSPSRVDDIDPNDIASVEIVKGPAASTLYGTQAANGVVRITTKRGVAGKTQWTAYSELGVLNDENNYPTNYFSWGHFTDSLPKIVNRQCTLTASVTLRASKGNTPVCSIDSLTSFNVLENPTTTPIGAGYRGQAGLNLSGGSDQLQYYLSTDYSNDLGTLRLSDAEFARLSNAYGVAPPYTVFRPNQLKSINLRSNIHAQATRTLDVTANLGVLNSTVFIPQNDNNVTGLLPSGLFGTGWAKSPSVYGFFLPGDVSQITTQQNINRLTGSLQANWIPTPWFTGRATAGLDYTGRTDLLTQLEGQGVNFSNDRQGRVTDNRASIYHYTADIGGTASFPLNPDLTSKTSAGFQYLHDNFFEVLANGQNLPPGGHEITFAATRSSSQTTTAAVTLGTYVEQEFGLKDRLFLTGGLRNDRNSAFGSQNRSVWYPKVSASWVMSQEPFFPQTPLLSNFRLRGAYGASGQQPGTTAALLFLTGQTTAIATTAGGAVGADQPGVLLTAFGNPALKPERSAEGDLGFDASVLHDLAKIEFTYYNKQTTNALVNVPLPPGQGVALNRFVNLGSTQNSGIELGIGAAKDLSPNIGVDGYLSFSHNSNKLKSLGPGIPTIINGENRDSVGFPLNGFWDHAITGFKDLNGDGIIEANEVTVSPKAVYLGSSFPLTNISLNAGVTLLHGKFRIGGQLDYRGDYKVYNLTERFRCAGAGFNCAGINNPKDNLFDQARAVAATTASLFNSQAGYVEDGTFLKLREVSITYFAPDRWAQYIGASALQFALTGRNLLKWTNYTGVDPEVNGNGQSDLADDFLTAPPIRTVALRVTVKF
jgi:TonB-linked SusC/RagA family outer membrane protein